MLRILAALFVLLGICGQANAQGASPELLPGGCGTANYTTGIAYLTVDSTGKACVNATVNASVGGFVPSLSYGTLTATASTSASTALPTNTGTVAFQNNTAVTVSCTLASGSAVATTNEVLVPAGSTVFLGTTGYDHAACINQTGSASNVIVMAGGTGLGTGFGGGSSGGGGGAITIASGAVASGAYSAGSIAAGAGVDGWDLTQGAIADAAVTAGATGSVSAKLRSISRDIGTVATNTTGGATAANQTTANTSLATIATNTGAAIPAGGALIGKVGIDQTTDGTTNGVRLTNGYPAGATPITASATGTTAATTATLAGTTGKTTYLCGYSIRANATGAATVTNTITGVITATLSSIMWVAPLASGIGIDEQIFSPCIPASGTNQAIAIVSGAPGSGGTVSSKGWGYQQ